MGDQPPQDIEQQHTDQTVSRRIRVDHWQRMSPAQRDAFAAHVLTGWLAGWTVGPDGAALHPRCSGGHASAG